ncbi:MAG: AEC family transporter [Pseudomonadota bacterium]
MQALLDVILPVFVVIAFGYGAVALKLFSDAGVDGLQKFTQNFAIPCLLFSAIATLDLSAHFDVALLVSFYTGAGAGFLAGLFGARWLFRRPWEDCVAIGFCCLFSNSVLLGLPITEQAYGPDALAANFGIIAIHAPFCYGIGVTVMEIVRNRGSGGITTAGKVLVAMFRNALVIGIGLGFAVNLGGVTLPAVISDALDLITAAALPAALFALGGVLVRYRPEGDLRVVVYICLVSLVMHPVIVWTMASIAGLSTDAFRSAVLTAAMAPGVNSYIFANMYGAARRVAASTVLIATALSIGSIWVWLQLLP